jgi:NAD-dependent SIR2 family protein deacetylase
MASTAHKTEEEYKEYFDAPDVLDRKVSELAQWIREANHTIFFTGAGISTSTGIGDFRSGVNTVLETGMGAWTRRAEAEKGNMAAANKAPRRTQSTLKAIPSPSHMAIVQLLNQGLAKHLISQNTDGSQAIYIQTTVQLT